MNTLSHISCNSILFSLVVIGILFPIATSANNEKEAETEDRSFITIWKTDNPGVSDDNQIKISTNRPQPLVFDYDIYWEDVNNTSINGYEEEVKGDIIITFPTAGTYRIFI